MNRKLLAGSSFQPDTGAARAQGNTPYDLSRLWVREEGNAHPLLRPREQGHEIRPPSSVKLADPSRTELNAFPHLTTFTLSAILDDTGVEYQVFPIEKIWDGSPEGPSGEFDAVLLSTTFIWERASLRRAVEWVEDLYPTTTLILGGQYSNLKYHKILTDHRFVRYIVRGDGELAIPALIRALRMGDGLEEVSNLVWRDPDTHAVRANDLHYIDLDAEPSPTLQGTYPVVPYESMRGCPFSCKYCSFPAASPKWRYKSAQKIADDFARYREENGAQYIKAMDSTFTVPPTRLRRLLPLLADVGVPWEAYTRANSLTDQKVIADLERAHCRGLSIGFESMNDTTLSFMKKQVTTRANRTAHELLKASDIDYRISFIVGYPGETPEMFEDTHRYLVSEFTGQFSLYAFMLKDETMPVWQDAERFNIRIFDEGGADEHWEHCGMDSATAERLQLETLKDVRWKSERAIHRLWQHDYEAPLVPDRSVEENAIVEKLVDRLGMLSADFAESREIAIRRTVLLQQLAEKGVFEQPSAETP
jgi:tRNA A37 methylthiotransferase MiaB